jgi:hypothetical protein
MSLMSRRRRVRYSRGAASPYNEKVDIYVDGVRQERPITKFSLKGEQRSGGRR